MSSARSALEPEPEPAHELELGRRTLNGGDLLICWIPKIFNLLPKNATNNSRAPLETGSGRLVALAAAPGLARGRPAAPEPLHPSELCCGDNRARRATAAPQLLASCATKPKPATGRVNTRLGPLRGRPPPLAAST